MQLSARISRPIGNNSAMHFADDLRTSASEQSPFSRIGQRESGCAPDLRRTAKVILALSDFFRKLLSLRILASNATFSCQPPLRRQNNGERLSRRFPTYQHSTVLCTILTMKYGARILLGRRRVPLPQNSCNPESSHSQLVCS